MVDIISPALPSWGHTLSHWILTRVVGSVLFFIMLGCAASAYDTAYPEPPKANPDMFDGGGSSLAAGIYAAWGIGFECCCALPLLLVLPGRIRQALTALKIATRRKRFLGTIVGWHLLLPVLATMLAAFAERDLWLALGLLGLGSLYALVAAGLGWALYARWLTDVQ